MRCGGAHDALLAEIEDALSGGYAEALAGDAWAERARRTLLRPVDEAPTRKSRELREMSAQHVRFQRDLDALRCELGALKDARDRLFRTAASA